MIYNSTSLVCQSNFVAEIASYLHVFNTHSIKTNTTTHALKLFLTSKRKLHEVKHASLDPWALLLFGNLGFGDKNQLFKKRKKEPQGWRVTQLLFLCYQPNCHMGFSFTTTRCSLQLTQRILTFRARRSLRTTNFVMHGCRFANHFFFS